MNIQNQKVFLRCKMKALGKLIDDEINKRGISIAELARRCKCERNTIYNIIYTVPYDPRFLTALLHKPICKGFFSDIIFK